MSAHPDETFLLTVHALICGIDANGQPQIIKDAGILVRDGRVEAVGDAENLSAANPGIRIDRQSTSVAMPGLINAHHHSGLTPVQLGVPFAPLELWLPQFMGMRAVDPRLDTLYSAMEMLESGTTSVHHIQGGTYGPASTWEEPANAIISAYGEIGMRASYSFMIRDQNQLVFDDDEVFLSSLPSELSSHFGPRLKASRAPVSQMLEFFVSMKHRWAEQAPETVRLQLAPANLHWCSDAALLEIFGTARAQDAQIHMHLDETYLQADYARRRTGKSAVRHLADLGCLGPDLTIGHGIWADAGDLDLLASHQCILCHNASSGLRLASGISPVNLARAKGVRVALGIDQCGVNDDRDMLQEMRVAWMLHREPGLFRARPEASDIFRMATEHGAATTGFGRQIGRLDPGSYADIVLINWASVVEPYMDERTPILDALLHRAKAKAVDKVFVGGRLVVTDGRVCSVDGRAVIEEIRDSLKVPKSDAEIEALKMTAALQKHIEYYYSKRIPLAPFGRYVFNQGGF